MLEDFEMMVSRNEGIWGFLVITIYNFCWLAMLCLGDSTYEEGGDIKLIFLNIFEDFVSFSVLWEISDRLSGPRMPLSSRLYFLKQKGYCKKRSCPTRIWNNQFYAQNSAWSNKELKHCSVLNNNRWQYIMLSFISRVGNVVFNWILIWKCRMFILVYHFPRSLIVRILRMNNRCCLEWEGKIIITKGKSMAIGDGLKLNEVVW